MKINATYNEICDLLGKAVGFKVDSFSVVKTKSILPGLALANKLKSSIAGLSYLGSGKIQAIKNLRIESGIRAGNDNAVYPYYNLSLAKAKQAVENWNKFLTFVEKYNRVPEESEFWLEKV